MSKKRKYRFAYMVGAEFRVDGKDYLRFVPRGGGLWATWIGDARLYRTREDAAEEAARRTEETHAEYVQLMAEADRAVIKSWVPVYYSVVEIKYAMTGDGSGGKR